MNKTRVIEQYQNERQVEYVFDASTYQLWIDNAEEPLRSASTLARNSAITRVEMLNLEKDCVILRNEADEEGNWGDLIIKRGLSGGRANACSRSTKNQSRSSNISSPNPNVATSSANHVTLTGNSSPGYSNRKWDVSGKSLPVIRLRSIRMPDFTLCATRF